MFEAVFPGAQLFPVLFYPEKYSCECVIMMGCMCVCGRRPHSTVQGPRILIVFLAPGAFFFTQNSAKMGGGWDCQLQFSNLKNPGKCCDCCVDNVTRNYIKQLLYIFLTDQSLTD